MTTIIGLAGRAGSGKDTVGEMLRDGHAFGLTSFAYPIKIMLCGLLGVTMDKWDDREWRETPLGGAYGERTPRYLAQTLGTEWGRGQVSATLWLDLALEAVEDEWPQVAITDVRFDNEAHRIRELGGFLVFVHRNGEDSGTNNNGHISERGVRPAFNDFHINNFGSLEELESQVNQVVQRINEIEAEREKANEEVQGSDDDPAGTDI